MQSAATIAEQAAAAQTSATTSLPPKGALPPPPAVRVETPGAIYDNGKIYLRGNPLKTTPEIICPHCKLPRLLFPISGNGSQIPDLTKQYCTRHPFVSKPGYDIYGNPFSTDTAKTKKERDLLKAQARGDKDSTPASQDTRGTATPPDGAGGNSSNANSIANTILKLTGPTKPASYIPWHTCPNCKRSLLITRFAQHLEKCLGISGRASSRNAMAKLAASSGATGDTPKGSRMGTPVPGGDPKKSPTKKSHGASVDGEGDADRKDGFDPLRKKKPPKKSNYIKKADREKALLNEASEKGAGTTPKSKGSAGLPAKRLPKPSSGLASEVSSAKRDRDGGTASQKDQEEGEESPRKKMKFGTTAASSDAD